MQLQFDFSPAYELVVSLFRYVDVQTAGQKHIEGDRNWREHVRSSLSPATAEILADSRLEILHRLNLLIWQCPGDRSVETFIGWLRELPPGEIYERMVPWVSVFHKEMKAVRDLTIEVLTRWNAEYFSSVESKVSPVLRKQSLALQQQAASLSVEGAVDLATRGLTLVPEPETERILLVPQHHLSPMSMIDYFQGLIVCQYPVDVPPDHPSEPPAGMSRALKALGDVNRLKVLQYVQSGPRTLKEITAFLGLAKSNALYHLAMLRYSGLIGARYGKNGIECYFSRVQSIDQIRVSLMDYVRKVQP